MISKCCVNLWAHIRVGTCLEIWRFELFDWLGLGDWQPSGGECSGQQVYFEVGARTVAIFGCCLNSLGVASRACGEISLLRTCLFEIAHLRDLTLEVKI
jgi:hypothetical protein